MHEEKQELEKWCLNLIDNFRKSYENLDELEQNQIYINYSAPSQIEIFWVSEPLEYQLFVLLHDYDRPDKEIIINGPFRGFQLEEEVIKIMDEPRWKKVIPDIEDNFLWDYDKKQMNKYSYPLQKEWVIPMANKCISTDLPIFYRILHDLETINYPFSNHYLYK